MTRHLLTSILIISISACSDNTGTRDPLAGMMAMACDIPEDDYPPENDDSSSSAAPPVDCTYTKGMPWGSSCRHAGGNFKHDWAADQFGNILFPDPGKPHSAGEPDDFGYGCDAVFKTEGGASRVTLDGIIPVQNVGLEMKTDGWESIESRSGCPQIVRDQILAKIEARVRASVMKEAPVAKACGIRYQLVVTDGTLYRKAIDWFPEVDVVQCQSCRNAPSEPSDWTLKPQAEAPHERRYVHFWLDEHGVLHEERRIEEIP